MDVSTSDSNRGTNYYTNKCTDQTKPSQAIFDEASQGSSATATSRQSAQKIFFEGISEALTPCTPTATRITQNEGLTTEGMKRPQSTADSPNRLLDRDRVEQQFKLKEFGDPNKKFYTPNGELIATGFNRMVYGDHGPYIEFTKAQIDLSRMEPDKGREANLPKRRFNLWYSKDGFVKAYDQLRTVADRPNPPRGKYACNNKREEGYADYQPGFVYVDPECFEYDSDSYSTGSSTTSSDTLSWGSEYSTDSNESKVSTDSLEAIIGGLQPLRLSFQNFN